MIRTCGWTTFKWTRRGMWRRYRSKWWVRCCGTGRMWTAASPRSAIRSLSLLYVFMGSSFPDFFFFLKNIFKKSEKINYCKVLFQVAFQRRPSSALSAPQFKRDLIWSYNDSWQKPSASRKIHTRAILWEKLLWAPVKINKTSQVKRGYKMRIKLVICYSQD